MQSMNRNNALRWLSILAGVGLMLIGAIGLVKMATGQGAPPGEPMALAAPDLTLVGLDGQPATLADWQGQRVLVNFWATWCPPCVEEMPALEAFYRQSRADGVVVVAVNNAESPETVRRYVEERGITMPVLLDPSGQLVNELDINYLPTTLFVNSKGVIRSRWESALSYDQMRQGARALR